MFLFAVLGCSNLGGFGAVDDAGVVTCDDGSMVGVIVASRQTCRPSEDAPDSESVPFCDVVQTLAGSDCEPLRLQSDRTKILTIAMDADGETTVFEAPCASDPDDPNFLEDEELDASFTVDASEGGAVRLTFDGDVRGSLSVEDCGG